MTYEAPKCGAMLGYCTGCKLCDMKNPDTVTIKRSELENVKEIIRLNLVMYSRKDEVALLSAFKILETALGEKK